MSVFLLAFPAYGEHEMRRFTKNPFASLPGENPAGPGTPGPSAGSVNEWTKVHLSVGPRYLGQVTGPTSRLPAWQRRPLLPVPPPPLPVSTVRDNHASEAAFTLLLLGTETIRKLHENIKMPFKKLEYLCFTIFAPETLRIKHWFVCCSRKSDCQSLQENL